MTAEGEYLKSIGFAPHQFVNGEWVPVPDEIQYSTMSGIPGKSYLACKWQKDGLVAFTGLNEKGHPPCLISPRPVIAAECNGRLVTSRATDFDMDRLIRKHGIEGVLRMGFEQEKPKNP